jgi:hypothetical protein
MLLDIAEGTNVVLLDPDVAEISRMAHAAINEALPTARSV